MSCRLFDALSINPHRSVGMVNVILAIDALHFYSRLPLQHHTLHPTPASTSLWLTQLRTAVTISAPLNIPLSLSRDSDYA
ncbi:MAG: hypothetical protein KME27_24000 [Lyngbya sp. HA4199-MV5]|nr:hypothetical protein [Lyngbya sp. HA4199-MV5]